MTRVDAALVPEQKSDFSTSRQSIPCSASSRNRPIPLMPAPTIRTETSGRFRSESNSGRIRVPSLVGLFSSGPQPPQPPPRFSRQEKAATPPKGGGAGPRSCSPTSRRHQRSSRIRSENVLERELRDARVARARDGPKGSAAAGGIRDARVVEQGVVENVKVLGPELHDAPLAQHAEAASEGGVPDTLTGTAK